MSIKAEPIRDEPPREALVPEGTIVPLGPDDERRGVRGDDGARHQRGEGVPEAPALTDDLVIVLMPRATLDATVALMKRAKCATTGALMSSALKVLEEALDKAGVPR